MNTSFKLSNPLTFGEEIGKAVTHAVAAFGMLLILPYTAIHTFNLHGALQAFGASVFVISLFLMFLSSTIYHSMLHCKH